MKAKLIMTVEQAESDHEAWEKLRMSGIGGSDVAVIMGHNPWKKPYALYCEKVGLVEPEDLSDNEAVEWGIELEPSVAKKFCEKSGKKVKRWGTVCNPAAPWQMANFDRLIVGEECGLECKTANAFKQEEWEGDNVPDAYYCQCQWYAHLSGFEGWWIACLIGGQHFEYKYIPRNDAFIAEMVEKVTDFWENHVLAKVPPEVDGSESCTDTLKKVYPESNGVEIALPSQANGIIARLDELDKTAKLIKEQQEEAKNELKLLLGENEVGIIGDRKVTWKTQKGRASIDSKKLQKEYKDVYEACVKYSEPTRVMRIK